VITIASPDGSTEATFVPEANLLCCSLRVDGQELLDQGHGVEAYAQQGKTMGVPLLHPWANRLARFGYEAAGKSVTLSPDDPRLHHDPNGLPIHGVLPGLLRWAVLDAAGDTLSARLLWSSDQLLALFPYLHELQVDATVTPGALSIVTSLTAIGEEDSVPVAFGYHPYLRLPGSGREGWQVSLGATRRLVVDAQMIPTGETEDVSEQPFTLGGRSLDDGFDRLEDPARFSVAAGGRELAIAFGEGYAYAQVYAPPGKDFICFEPMTAPANALVSGDGLAEVPPGGSYDARFTIALLGEDSLSAH
jgi:galactose mutarotase-like enzyme